MAHYILNKNRQSADKGGNFELHNENICAYLPLPENRISIGYFDNCHDAMKEAKRRFPNVAKDIDGCYWNCHPCHKE
jgi:hypothetical protein